VKFLVGYDHHPVSVARMYVRAMRRLGIEVLTIGPRWKGRYSHPEYDDIPDIEIPRGSPVWRTNFLTDVSQVDQVWSFDNKFRLRGKLGDGPAVIYCTDPHVVDAKFYLREYDYKFSAQKIPGTSWIPLAYDSDLHPCFNNINNLSRPIDVCFIGMTGAGYENRRAGLKCLDNLGLESFIASGLVFDDYSRPYNKSKIAYNWSSSFDIPMRLFEGMAMGCCVVTNRIPFLDELGFVEGTHYLGFSNIGELEKVVLEALNSGRWQEVAKKGNLAVQEHSYPNRVIKMLERIDYKKI